MNFRLKSFLTTATAGMLFLGLGVPASAVDERPSAPLVGSVKDLKKLNQKLIGMAERSSAATVSLVSQGGAGAGSGVIVSADGLVLTAAHVVASLSDDVIVIFPDGSRRPARKLGGDFDRDAAMVQIMEEGTYPFVEVGSSEKLLRNEWCVALGHPGGFDPMRTPPLRLGRILVNGGFVTTDCAVVGGDSGGPLFNVEGKVIGIHSNIGASLTENRHVPIDVFVKKWDSMVAGERTGRRFAAQGPPVDPNRPILGINLGEAGEDGGVTLSGVMEGSPAAKVGLQGGDLVTKVNGEAVTGAEELIRAVGKFKGGDELKVSYVRDGEEHEVDVKLVRLGDLMDAGPPQRERPQGRGRRNRPAPPKAEGEGEKEEPKAEAKPEEEPKAEPEEELKKQDGADAEAEAELKQLLEKALKEAEAELGPEQLKKMGGLEQLRRFMKELADTLGPEGFRDMLEMQAGGGDVFFESSMKALAPVTAKAAESTVLVQVDGKPVALGTVVSEEGWILTKNSETKEGEVSLLVGEKEVGLELLQRFPKRDLALYQADEEGLKPVRWANGKKAFPVGSLLTAADSAGQPLGIGLVSVKARPFGEVGFLGIQAGEGEGGVRVVRTTKDGPAQAAGLKADDVITAIDGKTFEGPIEFGMLIRGYRVDDEVEISYRRGEESATLKVKLAERKEGDSSPRFQRMNEMSGPLSAQLSGFPEALQHDIPLAPSECGGPLLDLNGRCVGINVSRAGRVKTLAIPASDLLKLLTEVRRGAGADATAKAEAPTENAERMKEREQVLKELSEVQNRLKSLEKRLEELNAR